MANRTSRTPEKEAAVLAALELHPSKSRACRSARVPRRSLYEWCAADPDFAARVEAARQLGIDAIEDALMAAALDRDTVAAIFMLKSWRPERYREKTETEHKHGGTVKHDHRHTHIDLSIYTPEEQVALMELAEKHETRQGGV